MAALFSWSGINCRPCSAADPTADVVKVDMDTSAPGKENARLANDSSPAETAERERQRREAEEAAEARRQASLREAAAHEEAERFAREQAERQRLLEVQERQRLADEQARQEALRKRQEEAKAERRRVAEEGAERQRHEMAQRDAATLEAFLKENNYRGVNEKRKTALKAKYPLHTAVKRNNDEMVRILLEAGADLRLADSNKLTPQQLASKLNSDGSFTAIHDRLLQASA